MKRVVFADPTAAWVPFATAIAICAVTWWGLWWGGNIGAVQATKVTLVLGVALVILMLFQGWIYWKTDVAELALDGDQVEAEIAKWIGPSLRIRFRADETFNWRVISVSSATGGKPGKPNIGFTVNGIEYRLSLFSAKTVDFGGLRRIAPVFFDGLLRTNPSLGSLAT